MGARLEIHSVTHWIRGKMWQRFSSISVRYGTLVLRQSSRTFFTHNKQETPCFRISFPHIWSCIFNPLTHISNTSWKTVDAKLYCQTLTRPDSDSDWKMDASMWGIKGKEEFSSNNRARQVSSLVNQRAARSTALKHVWDDALSIPCNYCPSPPLHILSDHQEYFYCMNVSCWNNMRVIVRACMCGQERKSERSDIYIPPPWV